VDILSTATPEATLQAQSPPPVVPAPPLGGEPSPSLEPNDLFARYGSLVDQVLKTFGKTADVVTSREDLRQEGAIGLLAAARSYRPDRGASFRTYAWTCVENAMLGAIRKSRKKIPSKLTSEKDRTSSDSTPPSNEPSTIFKESPDVPPTGGNNRKNVGGSTSSDLPLAEHYEKISDRTAPGPEEKAIHGEEIAAIREAVEKLPPKQKEVIWLRLVAGKTNNEVAGIMGISAGRSSQIWSEALLALEKILKT